MKHNPMWGGRFSAPPAETMRRLNDSFSFDYALLAEDIDGSIGWAEALGRCDVLSASEMRAIVNGLQEIRDELVSDSGEVRADLLPLDRFEDVHSFVESKLREKLGSLAGKLHTGRSRNDQVATDFRLYLKRATSEAVRLTAALAHALATKAGREASTALPGYTHLKQAEPITFGHWCLAYVSMLERDIDRFNDARKRADECPLGSGALAGSPVPVDRAALARSLGFSRPTGNSLDSVADRDAAAEYLFVAAVLMGHLSRMAEDLIIYSSDEFDFLELPDAFATGSSRMPQKKNPDVLELVRGHGARLIGELTGLLALLKGLPLAYNKDLQLDKEPAFRARAVISSALPALTGLIEGLRMNPERMRQQASGDLLLATQLADAISHRGIPFRQAHDLVSVRIAEAVAAGKTLIAMGPTAQITADDLRSLDVDAALEKKSAEGGTAPSRVADSAKRALERLEKLLGEVRE